jgi:hypothetical protein
MICEDSAEIGRILGDLLSDGTFLQHAELERHCLAMFHVAFMVSGMKTLSEASGAYWRAGMAQSLPGDRKIVLEVKCRETLDRPDASPEAIENELDGALREADEAIRSKNCLGTFKAWPGTVAGLSLAVYGRSRVKAEFVRDLPQAPPPAAP